MLLNAVVFPLKTRLVFILMVCENILFLMQRIKSTQQNREGQIQTIPELIYLPFRINFALFYNFVRSICSYLAKYYILQEKWLSR